MATTGKNVPSKSLGDDEIDLAELWGRLWDQRKIIAAITLGIFLVGCLYATFATRIYQATALLQVEPKKGGIPGVDQLSDFLSGNDTITQTEIQIIKSRLVLGSAIDQLMMDVQVRPHQILIGRLLWRERQGDTPVFYAGWSNAKKSIRLTEFQVSDDLKDSPLQLRVTGVDSYELLQDGNTLLKGKVGVPAQSGAVHLRVASLNAATGTVFDVTQISRYNLVANLQQRLAIAEQGKNTGVLQLSLTDSMPARGVAVLGTIADSYLMQNVERSASQASKSLEFVEDQLPKIRDQLNDAENKLNAYRQKSDSVDVSLQTKSLLDRLVATEAQINTLKLKESDISGLYTRDHPVYQSLNRQLDALSRNKADIEKQINQLPETQQEVLRLTRDVQTNQQVYLQMLNSAQELKIAKASTVGNVRIIDSALTAPLPVQPKVPLVLALSLLLGLMVSVGYVLLRMAMHRGLESPEQLEQLGLPVYAVLPISPVQQRVDGKSAIKHKRARSERAKGFLLASEDPGDMAIESLRSLRTSLHFAMLGSNNCVMITGASPGAGKSFVSANLAVVLASSSQRVLLIDADMRRGHLHDSFHLPMGEQRLPGLSELLSGHAELTDAIYATPYEGLRFMPRGQLPPNPAELLMQPYLSALVHEATHDFDLVLIDTPPIMAVTDAAIVGQKVGTTMLVVRYGMNTVREVETAMQRFEKSNVKVNGTIFNAIERQSNNYYYYDYEYRNEKTKS